MPFAAGAAHSGEVLPGGRAVGAVSGAVDDPLGVLADLQARDRRQLGLGPRPVSRRLQNPDIALGVAGFAKNLFESSKAGDARTYSYQGENIDNAYHLGFDLSVTKRYPVEASNSGVVAFTGDLGIYGNTVIIDHGLGLTTLYGHLSSIDVKEGEPVKQKQIIGKSGETGLAAGDHLHFGVYLNGVAVLPIEWWDEKWIRDNVTPKLEGSAVEAAEEPKPSPRTARKRRR